VLRGSDARTCISTHITSPRMLRLHRTQVRTPSRERRVIPSESAAAQRGAPSIDAAAIVPRGKRRSAPDSFARRRRRARVLAVRRGQSCGTARLAAGRGEMEPSPSLSPSLSPSCMPPTVRGDDRRHREMPAVHSPHIRPLQHLDRAYTSIRSNFRDRRRRQT